MAKSIFNIGVSWNLPKESIYDIALRIINIFTTLGNLDPVFFTPNFVGKNEKHLLNLNISYNQSQQTILADYILKNAKGDISKFEKDSKPTVDYVRDFGFSNVFEFYENNLKVFDIIINVGGDSGGGITIFNFNKGKQYSFSWYFHVLKKNN